MKKLITIMLLIGMMVSCSQKTMTGAQSVQYNNKVRGIPN